MDGCRGVARESGSTRTKEREKERGRDAYDGVILLMRIRVRGEDWGDDHSSPPPRLPLFACAQNLCGKNRKTNNAKNGRIHGILGIGKRWGVCLVRSSATRTSFSPRPRRFQTLHSRLSRLCTKPRGVCKSLCEGEEERKPSPSSPTRSRRIRGSLFAGQLLLPVGVLLGTYSYRYLVAPSGYLYGHFPNFLNRRKDFFSVEGRGERVDR